MSWQQPPSILFSFQPSWLSWQSPFLSTVWYNLPTSSSVCLFFFFIMECLGQSSAWRGQSLSRLLMLITTEIHNYCIARTVGEVTEKTNSFFQTVSYTITNYKKAQCKGGSYTGESILLEDQVHIARRQMTSRRKNEHNRSNVLAQ